jgi:hypothetical protein
MTRRQTKVKETENESEGQQIGPRSECSELLQF